MKDDAAILAGELAQWPSKDAMASLLRAAGLIVDVGRYSVRVRDCSHFAIREYGGDPGTPTIEADAASAEELIREAGLVSDALTQADLRHRFEVYDAQGMLRSYLHHGWPRGDDA